MRWLAMALFLGIPGLLPGVIIDQIAIVVGNSIVKDSDINRDLRVADFLNGKPLDLSENARKATASRLIDQIFIRKEIEIGDYPVATPRQADHELEQLISDRFQKDSALLTTLRNYDITAPDLKSHFLWQLTVLRFIDTRFKPAVLITDAEIETYYRQHEAAFRKEHPGKSTVDDVRGEISDLLAGERVNKLLFAWLDEQRKQTKIKYFEAGLR